MKNYSVVYVNKITGEVAHFVNERGTSEHDVLIKLLSVGFKSTIDYIQKFKTMTYDDAIEFIKKKTNNEVFISIKKQD